MSQFDSILSSVKNESYSVKKQLLDYLLRMVQNIKKLTPDDRNSLLHYIHSEVPIFLSAIPHAKTYKEKDLIFDCEDLLLGLVMTLYPSSEDIPEDLCTQLKSLVDLVEQEQYLERAINRIFQKSTIGEEDTAYLISLVRKIDEEYHRGRLYAGLAHYKDSISNMTDTAKTRVTSYLIEELQRYLELETLDADALCNMEFLCDVAKYFADDTLTDSLYDVLKLGYNNVNYYIAETLLSHNRPLPSEIIASLSQDLIFANNTYHLLMQFGKHSLFPAECTSAEYLAKSDLVHWLTYPTELGQAPDEIVYIGQVKYLFKKEVFFVFKFRSASDTLNEDLKNKWLIGWSSNDGGTFSNFDEYALYEKGSVEATLKNIKKKLIG